MSTEHDSLIGSAYNDGYDEGYKDGAFAALKRVRDEGLIGVKDIRVFSEIAEEFQ